MFGSYVPHYFHMCKMMDATPLFSREFKGTACPMVGSHDIFSTWPFHSLYGVLISFSQKADPLESTLILGKTEGRRRGWRRMRWWMASPNQRIWVYADPSRQWRTGTPAMLQSMGLQRVRHNSEWTTAISSGYKKKNNSKSKQFATINIHFSFTGLSYYSSAQLSSMYLMLGFRLMRSYFCKCAKSPGQA